MLTKVVIGKKSDAHDSKESPCFASRLKKISTKKPKKQKQNPTKIYFSLSYQYGHNIDQKLLPPGDKILSTDNLYTNLTQEALHIMKLIHNFGRSFLVQEHLPKRVTKFTNLINSPMPIITLYIVCLIYAREEDF